MNGAVELAVTGSVAQIVLNRPDKLNALTPDMLTDLMDVCDSVDELDVSVALIRGEGRSFCAGADVNVWRAIDDPSDAEAWIRLGHRAFSRFAHLRVPSVAYLHGHALGGGWELALRADVRLAAPQTVVGFPELRAGAVPGWGGPDIMRRDVGDSLTRRLVTSADPVDADVLRPSGVIGPRLPGEATIDDAVAWCDQLPERTAAHDAAMSGLLPPRAASPESVEIDVENARRIFTQDH